MELTSTFLCEEGIDENKLMEYMPEIQKKAKQFVLNGEIPTVFTYKEFNILLDLSSEVDSLDTDDEYLLLIKNLKKGDNDAKIQ